VGLETLKEASVALRPYSSSYFNTVSRNFAASL